MFGFQISDTALMLIVLCIAIAITFLVTWDAASTKYKEREFEKLNDAFDAGMSAIIVQLSTPELDRLSANVKLALEEREKREKGFSPDLDWQIQQAVDLANDEKDRD